MPILDLAGAKPLFPRAQKSRAQNRTLSPANTPAIIGYGGRGGFAGARLDRLTGDFSARSESADAAVFADNRTLRARARTLAINNFVAAKFLKMCEQNIVGHKGILFRAKVTGANGKETAETKRINQRIEQEWLKWTRRGSCSADGRFSFGELERLAIKNCPREGENIIKYAYGTQFNATGFALQPLDNDQLDDTYMADLGNGTQVRMGVEVDQYRRPLAYHFWTSNINDPLPGGDRRRVRVPADQVAHTFRSERPAQTRGYTWLAPAMAEINQLGRYQEAVIVAARASAAKFAVIQQEAPEGWSPDDEDYEGDDRNSDGTEIMTANAGEIPKLDIGETLNFTDPRFPTSTTKDFMQTVLRAIASALGVSYVTLANDLEGVNFSSIRAGLLEERDRWRIDQVWFILNFHEPIFLAWLRMALLTTLSDITLSPDQMLQHEWRARGWPWVDPVKDADAAILRLGNGLSTYTNELGEQGLDFEETIEQRAAEQAFIREKKGLVLGTDLAGDQGGKGVAPDDEAAAATVDAGKNGTDTATAGKQGGAKK